VTGTKWHKAVFDAWGNKCYFCGQPATDAMHIVGRPKLGKHRYACPEDNGRPGCRRCHRMQTDNKLDFSNRDYQRAVNALNEVLKVPIYRGEPNDANNW
jgi:hypothetical protein